MEPKKFQEHIDQLLELGLKESNQTVRPKTGRSVEPMESSLRYKPKTISDCEDCGQSVKYHRIEYLTRGLNTDYPFWRKNCLNCGESWIIRPKSKHRDK